MLTSRERVRRAIAFEGVDRIPIMHAVLPGAWMKHGKALHDILKRYPRDLAGQQTADKWRTASQGYQQSGALKDFVLVDDFAYVEPRHFMYGPPDASGIRQDEWKCVWRKLNPGIAGQVIGHPLADWDAVSTYKWPDPEEYWRFDEAEFQQTIAAARKQDKYIIGYCGNLWEKIQWLRGMENIFVDLIENPDRVKLLVDKVTEFNLRTIAVWSHYDLDAILITDDWGTQRQLMIKPTLWRAIFKPAYVAHFDAIHAAGFHVHFHLDGQTMEIIPDLIEMGVDLVNPQLSCMDLERLAALIAGKVCIRTDVDRQYILPRATPQEVDAYIHKLINLFGSPKGGFVGMGELNSDCKLENVEAMYEAFEKYGRYELLPERRA